MSATMPVGLHGTRMWTYDASMSLVLAEMMRLVEQSAPERRPGWWSTVERRLRIHAAISTFHLDLELGLDVDQREELASLFDEAAEAVRAREVFTREEAEAWPILDGRPVVFRGRDPQPTAPAAELGRALAELVRGTLPPAPPGTWWFYGAPGGRRTIAMRSDEESKPAIS